MIRSLRMHVNVRCELGHSEVRLVKSARFQLLTLVNECHSLFSKQDVCGEVSGQTDPN